MSFCLDSELLFSKAYELGFDDVGFCEASIPQEDIQAYLQWLNQKRHADMLYMENTIRASPKELYPRAKTAILFASYYKQPKRSFQTEHGLIASYARGRDYHNVHRKRLKKFLTWLKTESGEEEVGKGFSDSTPLLEKALAVKAGLGWFGKNTLLIHRRFGTFFLLSGCLIPFEVHSQSVAHNWGREDRCRKCQKCIDACPTQALTPFSIDAQRCISYQTIENRQEIPREISQKNPGYIFGCDICQDVCPHNFLTPPKEDGDFSESQGLGSYLHLDDLEKMPPESLYGTALTRRKIFGLRYNATELKENKKQKN